MKFSKFALSFKQFYQILLITKISLVTKTIPTHPVAGILRFNFLNVYLIKSKKKGCKVN